MDSTNNSTVILATLGSEVENGIAHKMVTIEQYATEHAVFTRFDEVNGSTFYVLVSYASAGSYDSLRAMATSRIPAHTWQGSGDYVADFRTAMLKITERAAQDVHDNTYVGVAIAAPSN